jgi:hypothetical protein
VCSSDLGYRELLDALADPNHEEHAEKLEWVGKNFDPGNVNASILAEAVHTLAQKWRRRTASRKRA